MTGAARRIGLLIPLLAVAAGALAGLAIDRGYGRLLLAGIFLVAVGWVSIRRPAIAIVLVYAGIVTEGVSVTSYQIGGLLVTIPKLAVVGTIAVWVAHCALTGRAMAIWHSVMSGLATVVFATGLNLVAFGGGRAGWDEMAGVLMLSVLTLLIRSAVAVEEFPSIIRALAAVTVAFVAFDLARGIERSTHQGRAEGMFIDPNLWAALLVVACPFLLGALMRDSHRSAGPLSVALWALFPIEILATQSRAGILTMLALLPAISWMMRSRPGVLAIGVLGAVAVVFWGVDLEVSIRRFGSLFGSWATTDPDASSLSQRSILVEEAIDTFRQHPFVGVGVGRFATESGYFNLRGAGMIAHNTYAQIAAEQGILGLVAWAVLAVQTFLTTWRAWVRAPTPALRSAAAGLAMGIAGGAMMAGTLVLTTHAILYFVLGIGLVLDDAARRRAPAGPPAKAPVLDAVAIT